MKLNTSPVTVLVAKKRFLLPMLSLLFCGALLATCSVEEAVKPAPPEPKALLDPIKYIVPSIIAPQKEAVTRGTPIDTVTQMVDFGFFCSYTGLTNWNVSTDAPAKMFNRKMLPYYDSAPYANILLWDYAAAPKVLWEVSSGTTAADRYTFFGYAPHATDLYHATTNPTGNGLNVTTTASTAGIPGVSYTVPVRVENHPDFMLADPVYNMVPSGHPVEMYLRHALTAIGIRVAGKFGERVTKITLTNVHINGSVSMDGSAFSWSLGSRTNIDFSGSIQFDAGQSYRTVTTAFTNPFNPVGNDDIRYGWLMMPPQALNVTPAPKVKIELSDGSVREVNLGVNASGSTITWVAGKRILYEVFITPAGSIMVLPNATQLPFMAQSPAAEYVAVVCEQFNGNPDPTAAWTLSVESPAASWLQLSLSASGAGAGNTVSGTGTQPVYLVTLSNNMGTTARVASLSLNGVTGAATVTQAPFPGAGFSGWLYVKQGSTGSGLSWSDAVPAIQDAFSRVALLQSASIPVHGILVAGGSGRCYTDSPNITGGIRVFGGWEGLAGTELPNNANAPYTSVHRDLAAWKAVITPPNGIVVSGSGSALDGFIVRDMPGSPGGNTPVAVNNGAYIHAVEILNNRVASPSTPALLATGSNTLAVNVLVSDNTAPVHITDGAKLVNGTIANNVDGLINNATVLNTVWWAPALSITYTGSNTVQYSAFLSGSVLSGIPAGTGNMALNTNNIAWYSPSNAIPGPHFAANSIPGKPFYSAMNDHAPMLGSGLQSLFDGNVPFLPVGASKTDILGNPRHHQGTDMGCYEDGALSGFTMQVSPTNVWLSGSSGNLTKTVTIISNAPWTIATPPANATLSANSGGAGVTTLTLTRNTTYGPSSFTVTNSTYPVSQAVTVDSYYIEPDELTLSNASLTNNTGQYDITVLGGSATYTIVGASSWITSATILPNGKLQLIANQSPDEEERTGYVTLAHANDPSYQVTFDVVQTLYALPPFNYLVVFFEWAYLGLGNSGDVDIAARFFGNGAPFDGQGVGWSVGNPVNHNSQTLLQWGGDATQSQGETVFLNAPILDADNTLPRYIKLEIYATWYSSHNPRPMLVTLNCYEGGTMVHNGVTNYYNVGGSSVYSQSSERIITTYRGVGTYPTTYTHVCDVIYDRVKHSARINWIAAEP